MNKCPSCDLGNFADVSACRRCNAPLAAMPSASTPMPVASFAGAPTGRTPVVTPLRMALLMAAIIVVIMLPALVRRLSGGPPPATPNPRPVGEPDERWMSNIQAFVRLGSEWNEVGPSSFDLPTGTDQQFAFWNGGDRSHPERAISIHTGVITGPKNTPDAFMAMGDEELIDASRTYRLSTQRYAWNANGFCGMVRGAMRRASYCRGEYTTPEKTYNGFIATTVLSKHIVTVIYFTTRDDANVWSEAQTVAASLRD